MSNSDDILLEKFREAFATSINAEKAQAIFALPEHKRARAIVENSALSESEVAQTFAKIAGLDFAQNFDADNSAKDALPLRFIISNQCLPTKEGDIVISYPPSQDLKKWALALSEKSPKWKIVPTSMLGEKIAQLFGVGADSISDEEADAFDDITESETDEDENAAIIKFVNEIITRALADRATDIHIEPRRDELVIRYRIDGNLTPVKLPENLVKFKDAVISRIKIMSRLNISEKRRPQDGRIAFTSKSGEEIDIRVSSLPTLYGESVSLRLLTSNSQPVGIEDLGFLPDDIERISKPLSRPHGIILVTGPTGSGKSTTLSAFIRRVRSPEIRIVTVEDPVEYEIEGVNQTQVQSEIGLTFSSVLRSVLRQDPDIIMVGEIRDRETAEIAIRASLTGHLVFSTLHTNDAAGALTRLVDMDIEPFLIASSVEMILAQRLVRRLCQCAEKANYNSAYMESCIDALGLNRNELKNISNAKKPKGCEKCRHIGYFGRVGIFEILLADDEIHSMIVARRSAQEIRKAARAKGMRTLQECGWELLKRGTTGLEEIMYYANASEERDA